MKQRRDRSEYQKEYREKRKNDGMFRLSPRNSDPSKSKYLKYVKYKKWKITYLDKKFNGVFVIHSVKHTKDYIEDFLEYQKNFIRITKQLLKENEYFNNKCIISVEQPNYTNVKYELVFKGQPNWDDAVENTINLLNDINTKLGDSSSYLP